jgi:hypothetical protein
MTALDLDTGFSALRNAVQKITDDLGSGSMEMVGDDAVTTLRAVYRARIKDPLGIFGWDWSTLWFLVTRDDMEAAARQILARAADGSRETEIASAPFRGGRLSLRPGSCWFTGSTYSYLVGNVYDRIVYDSRANGNVTKWEAGITDAGKKLLGTYRSEGMDASTSSSEKAAEAALRRMMAKKFRVDFFADDG